MVERPDRNSTNQPKNSAAEGKRPSSIGAAEGKATLTICPCGSVPALL
jgi:hypothetical protein